MKFGTKSLIALAAVASLHTAASALVIDGFDSPVIGQTAFEPPATPGFSVVAPTAIGGLRYIDVIRTAGPGAVTLAINNVLPGIAAISSDTATMGDFIFAYGNFNPDAPIPISGPASDFTLEGHDRITIGILRSDNLYGIEITLRDGGGNVALVNKPAAAILGPQTVTFLYAEFAGINFADIAGIQMRAIGSQDLDTQIDIVQTSTGVPVPAAVWAGGALLGGLVVRRMRRQA